MPDLSGTPLAWIGPVSIEKWMSTYGPAPGSPCRPDDVALDSTTEHGESDAKVHLRDTIQRFLSQSSATSGLQLRAGDGAPNVPYCSLFSSRHQFSLDEPKSEHNGTENLPAQMQSSVLFGEVYSDLVDDPCFSPDFYDPDELEDGVDGDDSYAERDDALYAARDARIRLFRIAEAAFANHLRCSLVAIVVIRNNARLLYFDVSGVVFSDFFLWRTTSHLGTLVQRLAAASDGERGFDPSATLLPSDSPLIGDARAGFEKAHLTKTLSPVFTWDAAFPPNARAHCCLYEVYDEPTGAFHRVVACLPHSYRGEYPGRGTRGFVAFDLDEERVIYMKRTWRMDAPEFHPERHTLHFLESHKVPHLPGCYFGGDVPAASRSLAEAYRQDHPEISSSRSCMRDEDRLHSMSSDASRLLEGYDPAAPDSNRFVLHVLLFRKIGTSLRMFPHSYDLCSATRDALHAHKAAYDLGFMHADISFGNILLLSCPDKEEEFEGILIDWDICVLTSDSQFPRAELVGTREFMSSRLLTRTLLPNRNPTMHDDLESFFHILLYSLFRYGPSTSSSMSPFLSFRQLYGPDEAGGVAKRFFFCGGEVEMSEAMESPLLSPPFRTLLDRLFLVFESVYRTISLAKYARKGAAYAIESIRVYEERFEEQCNHDYLIALFDVFLRDPSASTDAVRWSNNLPALPARCRANRHELLSGPRTLPQVHPSDR